MSKEIAQGIRAGAPPGRDRRRPGEEPGDPSVWGFMAGGGEMGAMMRGRDWAATPLGPVDSWPQSLRTSVSTCLECAFPILVWWGPDLVMLYNDEYRMILGSKKHPLALGACGRDVFPELWGVIGPMLDQVLAKGEATRSRDLLLVMNRYGYDEETYFSFSYSPIRDETGGIGGIFTPVFETTRHVVGERRLRTLRDLAAGRRPDSVAAACAAAAGILAGNPHDLPFALLYGVDEAGAKARLLGAAGIVAGAPAAPSSVDLAADDAPGSWPLGRVARLGTPELVGALGARFAALPCGAWPAPADRALVLPIAMPGAARPTAILVAAVSPRRALDDEHRSFFDLAAGQIGQTLAEAMAYEQERLRAQALAEIDRAKTLFFSNVSHEFRTPLTLMLGPLEDLAAEGPKRLPPAERALVDLAHRNARRLLRLVNALLDFSRIEAGRMKAAFEPVDLAALTADLASNFRSATERARLALRVEAPTLPLPVHVDRDMWEKIILNLLSNAFKFTFTGEIGVEVGASADGEWAEVVVSDTGLGIPEAELPHLFERFHRVPEAKGRSIEGSGIGLALVQELVRLHGGHLRVASRIGRGSAFTVRIPFGTDHLPADQVEAARSAQSGLAARGFVEEALRWLPDEDGAPERPAALPVPEAPEPGSAVVGRGRRVLVADDNGDMREYVRRLLEGRGYEVDAAPDGARALAAAARRRPDLVLCDVMMPGIDGFQLLQRLRADPATRDAPVIMVSARAGEEAKIEGLEAGADDYIVKPFSARELFARVDSAIQLAEARRGAAAAMREESQRMRGLFEQAPGFITILDGPDHVFEFANQSYRTLVGDRELIGRPVREVFPELAGQGYFELLDGVYRSGERFVGRKMPIAFEDRGRGEPNTAFLDFIYEPVTNASGAVTGIFVEGYDVTERVRDERHLNLLIDELNHRVKNTLAIVQGIARQTFRGEGSTADRLAAFEGRLAALAAAHGLLTRANWVSADLEAIVVETLAALGVPAQRWSVDGPPVRLEPKCAVTLAMAFHELGTNARKYGAFCVDEGAIAVSWMIIPNGPRPDIHIRWEERGGPPVAMPTRRGFGSRMIQSALANELHGQVRVDWRPAGLICEIHAPLPMASAVPSPRGAPP
jgi:signal transduction histidine kinase/CheY-like chemotaxis protein